MTDSIKTHKPSLALLRPRITEKAAILVENNAYTFEVGKDSTKTEIATAIKEMYKVTPIRINIIAGTRKVIFRRGKKGVKTSNKKAVVLLKKGDKIEFI